LDSLFGIYDSDNALRPTIINAGGTWRRLSQSLFSDKPDKDETLQNDELVQQRTAAYDLLEILSRAGSLAFRNASLHVIIAATHSFDKSVHSTVIEENINPIEAVQRSTLILTSTIFKSTPSALIQPHLLKQVEAVSPNIFKIEAPKPIILVEHVLTTATPERVALSS